MWGRVGPEWGGVDGGERTRKDGVRVGGRGDGSDGVVSTRYESFGQGKRCFVLLLQFLGVALHLSGILALLGGALVDGCLQGGEGICPLNIFGHYV